MQHFYPLPEPIHLFGEAWHKVVIYNVGCHAWVTVAGAPIAHANTMRAKTFVCKPLLKGYDIPTFHVDRGVLTIDDGAPIQATECFPGHDEHRLGNLFHPLVVNRHNQSAEHWAYVKDVFDITPAPEGGCTIRHPFCPSCKPTYYHVDHSA